MAGLPHRTGLVSDFCSSAPRFASGFLSTPHRCDAVAPCSSQGQAFGYRFRSLRPEEDFHLQVQCHAWHTMIGVGRTDWVRSPLPPNRTGGSPASGSPVDGSPARGLANLRIGVLQAKKPMVGKEDIGPPDMVG